MKNQKNRQRFTQILFVLLLAISQIFIGVANGRKPMEVSAAAAPRLAVTNLSLSVGQTHRLRVTNADQVQWSSSRKSVATVSSKGLVRAKKAGKTTITATVGSKKLKCYVVVNNPSEQKKDVLIAFFSQTETTTAVAKQIQKLIGGDLLRIRPRTAYTSNYDRLVQVAQRELENNSRPTVKTLAKNIDSYDVIYIGYPIWWGNAPRVILTFLEQYDLTDMVVIPFCTSGGSTIEESMEDLKQSCAGAEWKDGYTADAGDEEEIREWLTEIGELEPEEEESESGDEEIEKSEEEAFGKLLVAYFSWSGTSERIAEDIIAQTGADYFRIEREIPYSTDYTETAYGDAKDEADNNARPPIKEPLASIEKYDKIIICYPIWWHTAPMTVGTFLESYDLTGKTIYPISQSASMDRTQYEQSVEFIRECAKGASVDDGIFTRDSATIEHYVDGIINKQ